MPEVLKIMKDFFLNLNLDLNKILSFEIFHFKDYRLTVFGLVSIALIFVVTYLLVWLVKKALERQWRFKKIDDGSQYALFQIIKYTMWTIAIVIAMESAGIKITILLAGSAALLVGLGLGLQQTFNDFVSGIILLLEGSIKVQDVIQIDNEVVRVIEISLRVSKVRTRDDIIMIVPNSKIVNDKVINWSHQIKQTRFRIKVGVAYGSDVDLVKKVLEDSAAEHPDVSKDKNIEARLINFGDSSLDFELYFFCDEMFRVEKTNSDIRRTITKKFRENKITIPFPQRDLHIKSGDVSFK